ncbi:MAG TPA: hypothetical protein VFE05_10040 [Longimicrobiaceae bacterium]|jgi:hypothetical protein|nr:hypothetical protein [Longimicrobiaceae bacterium]
MSFPSLEAPALAVLRAELEAVPGVHRVLFDPGERLGVYVVCDQPDGEPAELKVRAILVHHGLSQREADVQFCHLPAPQPRRRVKFMSARVESRPGRASAAVELEWGGVTYTSSVDGESGPAMELRLAALSTLRTLEALLQRQLKFHLVGIKSFRAFDTDVVVVVLRTEPASASALVGASLDTENPHRSAALAVLNATNRVLGNYLSNVDV